MDFSVTSKTKLRYFSISNPNFYLNYLFNHSSQPSFCLSSSFKTLASAKPSSSPISSSNLFFTKPTCYPSTFFASSARSASICSISHPHFYSSQSEHFNANNGYVSKRSSFGLWKSQIYGSFRCFSVSSIEDSTRQCATPKQVSDIIQLIRSNEDEMESKLNSMNETLSVASLNEILRVLSCDKVSALRFFNWTKEFYRESLCNSDICSLFIDNCGRRDDYEEMRSLLQEFSLNHVCLTEKAFGFLPVMLSSKALMKRCIWKVVELLNEVGGLCRVSGVRALIQMFSNLGSFEMAKYVLKKTERKVSYYNIIMREMCRRCYFDEARDMLDEMRRVGCEPNTLTYNYLLGGLCKNGKNDAACKLFEEMKEKSCPLDEITYEIFIYSSCRFGDFKIAHEFCDKMVLEGLKPRISTHAAFIKGYFSLGRYEEAYKYVVESADKYKYSTNAIYCLLASLHDRNGNPVMAQDILVEMIDKGLRPSSAIYKRVLKHLQMSSSGDLVGKLCSKYSSLS